MHMYLSPTDPVTEPTPPLTSLAGRPARLRRLAVLWIVCSAFLLGLHLWWETAVRLTAGGNAAFGDDFINFWSAPRLAFQGRVADIYDFGRFHDFQKEVLGVPIHLYPRLIHAPP